MIKKYGKRRLAKILTPIAMAVMGITSFSYGQADDYTTWTHSRSIVINTSSLTGMNIATDLTDFPYLIRLKTDSLFGQAMGKGEDIRFASAAGAHLSYQIESWDLAGQRALIWVKVDTIHGNNDLQSIKMYWGKSASVDSSSGPGVFSKNFRLTYHCNNDPAAGAGAIKDQSKYANNGTPTGMLTTDMVAGQIGNGYSFNGTSAYIASDSLLGITGNAPLTISFWANVTTDPSAMIFLGDTLQNTAFNFWSWLNVWYFESEDATYATDYTAGTVTLGKWTHVTVSYDGAMVHIFANGAELGVGMAEVLNITNAQARIGRQWWGGMFYYLSGILDEVQIADTSRSADWIRLSYLNQRPMPDTFPSIHYAVRDTTFPQGSVLDAIPFTPVITGDLLDSITVSPAALPLYLYFDPTTASFSGLCDVPFDQIFYVTVWNGLGSATDTVHLICTTSVATRPISKTPIAKESLLGLTRSAHPAVVYSLASAKEVEQVSFDLYDLKGHVVWSKSVAQKNIRDGIQSITIDGRSNMAAGVYFIVMRVKNSALRATSVRKMKLTLMHN